MIKRPAFALRWRIATLSALAIALLSLVATLTTYFVARASLIDDLQAALQRDAEVVVRNYTGAGSGSGTSAERPRLDVPTGGVIIQLYSPQGELLGASTEAFETLALPAAEVQAAAAQRRDWSGKLAEQNVQAVIASVNFAHIAVLAPTDYITQSLGRIARALSVATLIIVALSGLIGYLVAVAAMLPISQLANLASRLDPDHLVPIYYQGPADEVGQLSRVLNNLIARLSAAINAQRSFLAETSHELRTPLTSLQGFLERGARRANPEVRGELQDAKRIAQTMSRLVADLLQLSRGELVREMVPHLLDPYIDILEPVAEEFPGVVVEGSAGIILLGDPERLRQLIRNLTFNAVRATEDPKAVTLGLESSEQWVTLFVRDTGPGIPSEALEHIFDKFYKGPGGGAGLGLAIAKQIAAMHNGGIEVSSELKRGTTFFVRLPALKDDISED